MSIDAHSVSMSSNMSHYYLASTYGSNNFGTCTYDSNGACTTTGASSGGSLVDTGTFVLGFVTIAAVIIFVALVVRIWKRKRTPTITPHR